MKTQLALSKLKQLPGFYLLRSLTKELQRKRVSLAALIVPCLILIYALLRIWNAPSYCLWVDEVYSLQFARESWNRLIDVVADDIVHPPFFYMVLKGWIAVGGENLTWLRLFPILWSVAAIAPFLGLCRQLELKPAQRNLALFLLAINAFLIHYAQELRMYSMLQFISLSSLYLFVRYVQTPKAERWLTLSLFAVNLLLVYTHYYGWLVLGTEVLYVLIFHPVKRVPFSLSVALVGVLYIPWALMVVNAITRHRGLESNLSWNNRPGVLQVARLYAGLNGAIDLREMGKSSFFFLLLNLPILLLNLPVLLWGYQSFKAKQKEGSQRPETFWLLAMLTVLPVAGAAVLSHMLSQSIWGDRHLIVVAAPYLLLITLGIYALARTPLRAGLVCGLIVWTAATSYFDPNARTCWDTFVQQMATTETGRRGVNVYSTDRHLSWHVRYYLAPLKETRFSVQDVADLSSVKEERCWILFLNRFSRAEEAVLKEVRSRGYVPGELIHSGAAKNRVTLLPLMREEARYAER